MLLRPLLDCLFPVWYLNNLLVYIGLDPKDWGVAKDNILELFYEPLRKRKMSCSAATQCIKDSMQGYRTRNMGNKEACVAVEHRHLAPTGGDGIWPRRL